MGVGAANVPARLAASVGLLGAVAPRFQPVADAPHGGVLMALPALLAMGLSDNADALLDMPQGYCGPDNILLLPAFMALARIEPIESLRHSPPGEWGKLPGLCRAPEARTLRAKVVALSRNGKAEPWGASPCEGWMEDHPDAAGTLYVDGHVRVYHGGQTKLPRHYVARQKLCLRASADYWVNAGDGQPFFVVNRVVDPVLIEVIEQDILPRLEKDAPNQPDEAMLEAKPPIHRFTPVFDREGYSPDLLLRLKTKRIACLTYHKHPEPDWSSRHIKVQDLPEEERFRQLSVYGKQFVDTIKMAAYRAETAMANCPHNIMLSAAF